MEKHLLMSMTAQRKDISDPEVIHEFAEQVGDMTHLDYIYLARENHCMDNIPTYNNHDNALIQTVSSQAVCSVSDVVQCLFNHRTSLPDFFSMIHPGNSYCNEHYKSTNSHLIGETWLHILAVAPTFNVVKL